MIYSSRKLHFVLSFQQILKFWLFFCHDAGPKEPGCVAGPKNLGCGNFRGEIGALQAEDL